MIESLLLLTLLSGALLTGNEFTVGAFIHPLFNRLPEAAHAYAAREAARFFGMVMPFWMAINLLLSASLLFVAAPAFSIVWWLFAAATALFALVIVFSVVGPVPINNQIKNWQPENLPADWRSLRRRWDALHRIRVVMLLGSFVCLSLGVINYSPAI